TCLSLSLKSFLRLLWLVTIFTCVEVFLFTRSSPRFSLRLRRSNTLQTASLSPASVSPPVKAMTSKYLSQVYRQHLSRDNAAPARRGRTCRSTLPSPSAAHV